MVQAVKEAFAQHVRINWDLVIKWIEGSPIDFPYCVTHIEPELEKTLLPDRIDEFEDLFRKLFFEYEQITISQLIWSKEGRICLEVFAFSGEKEEQMIVTCGRVNDLEAEEVNFNKHTPKGYPGFSQPIVKETFRYAAIARAISKQEIDLIMSFAFFFREMSEKQIRDALENLYQSTMASWHLQDLTSEGIESLAQTYRNRMNIVEDHYPLEGLKAYMEMLTEEAQSKRLMEDIFIQDSTITFKFPNGQSITLPDPFTRLYEDASFPKPEIMYGTTLGGLSANSILVDRECQTWPTDFSRIGTGLILKDYISLETDIRFNLLRTSNLISIYDFERQLIATNSLIEVIPPGDVEPECRKALVAILTIRRLAAQATKEDLIPYYIGLFFYTVEGLLNYNPALKWTKREITIFLHRWFLSAWLCSRLDQIEKGLPKDSRPDMLKVLQIDEVNKEVVVDGRKVPLTPTEYNLLIYLYHHPGQLCKRLEILRDALGIANPDPETSKGLLNTHIDRLRKKIEADPSQPVYIETVRGEGYRLKV